MDTKAGHRAFSRLCSLVLLTSLALSSVTFSGVSTAGAQQATQGGTTSVQANSYSEALTPEAALKGVLAEFQSRVTSEWEFRMGAIGIEGDFAYAVAEPYNPLTEEHASTEAAVLLIAMQDGNELWKAAAPGLGYDLAFNEMLASFPDTLLDEYEKARFVVQPANDVGVLNFGGYMLPWQYQQTSQLKAKGNCYLSGGNVLCNNTGHDLQLDFGIQGSGINGDIFASKPGTVVFVKESSGSGLCSDDAWRQANAVVVQHSASEYSWYLHLAQNSVPVNVGDSVGYGTKVGVEGATGYACGAHLHFMSSTGHNTWTNPDDPNALPWATGITAVDFSEASWDGLTVGTWYTSQNTGGGSPPTCDGVTGPSGYAFCSCEDVACDLPGTSDVAFGTSGNYLYKYGVSGSVACTRDEFGGDPIFGTKKGCFYKAAGSKPARPSNLHKISSTETSITMGWNDDSNNEDGFKILRWDGANWPQVGSVGSNVTSYTDSGLTCGSGSTYTVVSYNSHGESNWAEPFLGTSTSACPVHADLTITDVMPLPTPALMNDDIRVRVRVRNTGGTAAEDFWLDLFINDVPGSCPDNGQYYIGVEAIPAGGTQSFDIIVPAGSLSSGTYQLRALADSGCHVTETNNSNNTYGPVAITVSSAPSAPSHDDFNSARAIAALAYTDTPSVSGATRASDDPTAGACNLERGMASVWYRYTPTTNSTLYLDTIGSSYDTYLAVWRGVRGSLTPVDCTDDIVAGVVQQSVLQVNLNAGTTYYIEVAEWTWPVESHALIQAAASRVDPGDSATAPAKVVEEPDLSAEAGGTLQLHARVGHGTPSDYDRDSKTDPAKFLQSAGQVWWLKSSSAPTVSWASAYLGHDVTSYVPRSDFDGDGQADPAKFVQSAGAVWYIKSTNGAWASKYVGGDYNTLASGSDFDGDGKTDFAKYLQGQGSVWYYRSSLDNWAGIYIGSDAAPYLSGSDYDGDGKTDMAKYIPAAGAVWYLKSSTGAWRGVYIGSDGVPVAGSDFDGDGKTDMAKYVAGSRALWYKRSSTGAWIGVYMGPGTFTYVTASDFDGDGKTDPAKFETTGKTLWYLKSTTGAWEGKYMGGETYQVVN